MAKILNFDSFGAVAPHFCPDKREIWHWGADRRGQCVAPGGRKPIFGQLNKCNTGMSALRAGLSAINASRNTVNAVKLTRFSTSLKRAFAE